MKKFLKSILVVFSLATLVSCSEDDTPYSNSFISSPHPLATEAGKIIYSKGGNAFDAMIATEFALAVSYPFAGNLGGGGFMVYRQKDGTIGALDYREKAPLAATKNMYLDAHGNVDSDKSQIGALAVGVPGTIAGLFESPTPKSRPRNQNTPRHHSFRHGPARRRRTVTT